MSDDLGVSQIAPQDGGLPGQPVPQPAIRVMAEVARLYMVRTWQKHKWWQQLTTQYLAGRALLFATARPG
jgi:hypothetical protein